MISVLHTVASLDLESGGPSQTVSRLCSSLSQLDDIAIALVSQVHRRRTAVLPQAPKVDLYLHESRSRQLLRFGIPLRRALNKAFHNKQPSIVHDHGVWSPSNHFVASLARRSRIPRVIHPRGMLEPWALNYRAWKKHIALRLYQRYDLDTASLLFATADQEAESFRKLGLKQPIAVIPNGVEIPVRASAYQERTLDTYRNAIFLSRIHPKKGLINLVHAWAKARPTGWRLKIAGPDEGGHLVQVMELARTLSISKDIDYLGVVGGEAKARLFESADLLLMPSLSENFGLVVAEALAYGIPVVTTRGTPWQGVVAHRCGWWIEPSIEALASALNISLSTDSKTLREMGERGRTYAQEFNWTTIARRTAEVYRWILGQGPRPICVVT
jgi:glycosyltransferase involved in cell wall biosynthesis